MLLDLGLKGELEPSDDVLSTQDATNGQSTGNITARPVPDTLHLVPYVGSGQYRVGEILCETFHSVTGIRQEELPR